MEVDRSTVLVAPSDADWVARLRPADFAASASERVEVLARLAKGLFDFGVRHNAQPVVARCAHSACRVARSRDARHPTI